MHERTKIIEKNVRTRVSSMAASKDPGPRFRTTKKFFCGIEKDGEWVGFVLQEEEEDEGEEEAVDIDRGFSFLLKV